MQGTGWGSFLCGHLETGSHVMKHDCASVETFLMYIHIKSTLIFLFAVAAHELECVFFSYSELNV